MTTNKLLPVALVAALLGGTVGALVMRPSKNTETAQVAGVATRSNLAAASEAAKISDEAQLLENELAAETKGMSVAERVAFRDGFAEGLRAANETDLTGERASAAAPAASRVVYRTAPRTRTRYVNRTAPRRVYYDYGERKGRSFWSKHRDKLTVAAGTGGGALIGGLVGGKKGALIGGLAGAGGSALYTYKLRKRDRRY
jgi:hypothetical protein